MDAPDRQSTAVLPISVLDCRSIERFPCLTASSNWINAIWAKKAAHIATQAPLQNGSQFAIQARRPVGRKAGSAYIGAYRNPSIAIAVRMAEPASHFSRSRGVGGRSAIAEIPLKVRLLRVPRHRAISQGHLPRCSWTAEPRAVYHREAGTTEPPGSPMAA